MVEKTKVGSSAAIESFELAGIAARFVASIIDSILIALIAAVLIGVVLSLSGARLVEVAGLALPLLYHWYFWTRLDGQTPGKSALGIRVIKVDGSEISGTDALIRAIGYHVSAAICGLGYIWAIFDRNNQTWHDKLAGTYVVTAKGA